MNNYRKVSNLILNKEIERINEIWIKKYYGPEYYHNMNYIKTINKIGLLKIIMKYFITGILFSLSLVIIIGIILYRLKIIKFL